jgi:hypothetical protein
VGSNVSRLSKLPQVRPVENSLGSSARNQNTSATGVRVRHYSIAGHVPEFAAFFEPEGLCKTDRVFESLKGWREYIMDANCRHGIRPLSSESCARCLTAILALLDVSSAVAQVLQGELARNCLSRFVAALLASVRLKVMFRDWIT